ncbi:MAG: high frequency lysogenization protein HflD [Pseudomonadales bacterium]|jgi:high frequency lysogenization protein|nr:high frequency lysogenization protein HflD [Pseudomonadales bacterium]
MDNDLKQTLALAGAAQAGFLIYQLAHHGLAAHDKLAPLVQSLFVVKPRDVEEVYGETGKLRLGLQLMVELIEDGTASQANAEAIRYVLNLFHLQSRLHGNSAMLEQLRRGIDTIAQQYPEAQRLEDSCLRELSKLYQDTISQLGRRIQVRGDMRFLQNELVADKVRVTLLAGIRSAWLWQQVGGRRWHLLFRRKRLLIAARKLLSRPRL